MKTKYYILLITLFCGHFSISSQYTYWTYDGSDLQNTNDIISVVGKLRDTTFQTIGGVSMNGVRGYTATHSIATGQLISSQYSDHGTFSFFGASGDSYLSWHFMPDGGFVTVRAIITENGDQPVYIRFAPNMDTLWVNQPTTWVDPFGQSGQNLPVFMLPLWNGQLLSVTFTRVSPLLNFFRFLTHDPETGVILTDHLWNRQDVDFDNTIYGAGITGAIQTDEDSIFAWGRYSRYALPNDRNEPLIAKFDLNGNMGNHKLLDLDDPNTAIDIASLAVLNADTIEFFYSDGIQGPEGFNYTPFTAQLKVKRLYKETLEEFDEIVIPLASMDNLWLTGASFSKVIRTQDGGFLAAIEYRLEGNNIYTYLIKLDSNFSVEWNRMTLSEITGGWVRGVLLECSDRSIINGGGLLESLQSNYSDYFIKLDACGYTVPSDCPEFVSVADGEIVKEGFRLWPNPGTGAVNAIVPTGATRLQVVDAAGREVYSDPLYYPRQTWHLEHLPVGVYTFIVHSEKGQRFAQRWAKTSE
jgi:hypothetical protein